MAKTFTKVTLGLKRACKKVGGLSSWMMDAVESATGQKAWKAWNAGKVGMTLEVWNAGKLGNVRKTRGSEWLEKPGELEKLG